MHVHVAYLLGRLISVQVVELKGSFLPAPPPRLPLRMRVPVALNTALSEVKVQGRFDHTLTHPAHPDRCF